MTAEDIVGAARRVAEVVLAPVAEATDRAERVPAENLRALADAGLFGVYGPVEHGGSATPAPLARQLHRVLGGACGATYFVWAQHQGPSMLLGFTPNAALRERWLEPLCTGAVIGGTAFAHLRRPGPPAVLATPHDDGWRLNGTAPWATSWGMAGLYSVAAFTTEGKVLWSAVEGRERPGLQVSEPLSLAAMQSTRTVQLHFDGLAVSHDAVLLEIDAELWWPIDDAIAVRLNPAVLGVADRALSLLAAVDSPGVEEAHTGLTDELDTCAEQKESLAAAADAGSPDADALSSGRAWGIDLAQRASLALLTAVGGRGMERSQQAQRLVREAAFYSIQAQTARGRAASLRRLGRPGSR